MKEYKSIEQRIYDFLKPVKKHLGSVGGYTKDFLEYAAIPLYGMVASMFRLPTAIRKFNNRQAWIFKAEEIVEESGKPEMWCAVASLFGIAAGLVADFSLFCRMGSMAHEKNYIPLILLGATNLASGIFELVRLPRSKQERLEIKAQEKPPWL